MECCRQRLIRVHLRKSGRRYILQIKPVLLKILTNIEDNDYEALCHWWFNLLHTEPDAQIPVRHSTPLFS